MTRAARPIGCCASPPSCSGSRGYAATTTRELSDRLGIQKVSLYHHIRGKEDLLFQISMESLRLIGEAVREAADTAAPTDRLPAMIIAHVLSALRDQDLHTTMLIDLRSLSPARQTEVRQRRAGTTRPGSSRRGHRGS